ncbi:MAG TPA: gliding motility protein GldM [Prolixibacteraceae bacterium]
MSSSSGNTPRQKMIGLMYLVLTAMLALNVSIEVMNAFSLVNDSVLKTNESVIRKLKDTFRNFEKDYQLNENEVKPFYTKAKEAQRLSVEFVAYIENLRDEIIAKTENIPIDSARKKPMMKLERKDDYVTPTSILLGSSDNGSNGKSGELKQKIIEYREKMLDLVDPKYQDQLKIGLETEGEYLDPSGAKQSWEVHNFYDIPLAAIIPILNKIISDVNNTELDVVTVLHKAITADDFKYERIEAKILPKANYLFIGDQYEAEVIVAAFDTTQSPKVYLMRGVDSLPVSRKDQAILVPSQRGRVKFNFPANSAGLEKYAGFVSVFNSSGIENTYHFHHEYIVANPSLAVSATNMNVLYVGVNNPLSISVSGVPRENIYPTISCGTLKPNPGKGGWLATVPGDCKQASVEVSVKNNGGMKRMGSEIFRVKKLPDPVPYIAGKNDGFISRDILISFGYIIPKMPIDFEFDYSFQVLSFRMTMQRGFSVNHYDSQNNKLTDEMIKQIKNTNRGQSIIFEEIVALGPDGANRILPPLIISIN